jgi:putative membrane protein
MIRKLERAVPARFSAVGVIVMALALGACGGGQDDADAAASEEAAAAPAAGESAPALTDAEIAHITVTANTIDAEMGQLAQTRAQDEDVLAFARTMVSDHQGVNAEAQRLATQLNLTPVEHQVSRDLTQSANAARAAMDSLTGPEFERAYMQREVEYHQAVLSALDNTLIPSAQNPQLRALLENVRPAIEAHLTRARQIRAGQGG